MSPRGGPDIAATITAHHLVINRNAIFAGGIRPHLYCLPIAKREKHRRALRRAATSGNPAFFLGTDSAPHAIPTKETACGCAGIFTAPAALEIYAEVFEEEGALDRFEAFASLNGPAFYRLPVNETRITLRREAWTVPERVGEGELAVMPFRGRRDAALAVAARRRHRADRRCGPSSGERFAMSAAMSGARERAAAFCPRYGLRVPILMAPMAGACPVGLAAAVANAGGMGGFGALTDRARRDRGLGRTGFAARATARFQINLWVPDPPPRARPRARGAGARIPRAVGAAGAAGGRRRARRSISTRNARRCSPPRRRSSRRSWGCFRRTLVAELKARGIAWFACATTLGRGARSRGGRRRRDRRAGFRGRRPSRRVRRGDGRAADGRPVRAGAAARRQALGADHRDRRHRRRAQRRGGADPGRQRGADRHGVAALPRGRRPRPPGPTRWPISTPRRRCRRAPFPGRLGRSIATDYVRAAAAPDAPAPAPYPVQRGLTAAMREAAVRADDVHADAGLGRSGSGAGPPGAGRRFGAPALGGGGGAAAGLIARLRSQFGGSGRADFGV